jgi:hypothetical protein
MHAEHMMLVYEETPGIPVPVLEAGENTATAPHNIRLAVGNPDHQLDALHLFGHDQFGAVRPGVKRADLGARSPEPRHQRPERRPRRGVVEVRAAPAREVRRGARASTSRASAGISPAEALDALIKLEWVQAAQKRWLDESQRAVLTAGKRALGVDVANSEDGDEGAIARGKGSFCFEVEAFPCPNANDLGFRVHLEMNEQQIEPENVGVDSVGVGVGTVNELRKRDKWIRALNGGSNRRSGARATRRTTTTSARRCTGRRASIWRGARSRCRPTSSWRRT